MKKIIFLLSSVPFILTKIHDPEKNTKYQIFPLKSNHQAPNEIDGSRNPKDGNWTGDFKWLNFNVNVTSVLQDILDSQNFTSDHLNKLSQISANFENCSLLDVALLEQILNRIHQTQINLDTFSGIVSNILRIQSQIFFESYLKSRILGHIDNAIKASQKELAFFVKENFALKFCIPENCNIPVVINEATKKVSVSAKSDGTHKLYGTFTLNPKIKNCLDPNAKITISIFLRDVLFESQKRNSEFAKIIFKIILPENFDFSLEEILLFQPSCSLKYSPVCSDVSQNLSDLEENSSVTECNFWVLPQLKILVIIGLFDYPDKSSSFLTISFINGLLSFLGFLGIILSAVLFKKWRSNKGNQILLNFSIAIMAQIFIISINGRLFFRTKSLEVCMLLGAFLHYFLLCQFSWMFVIAILQFKRFVIVFGATPEFLVLKACLIGWGVPLIFVGGVLLFHDENYVRGTNQFCFPTGMGFLLGLGLPVSATIIFNLFIFLYIIYSICFRKFDSCDRDNQIMQQWRVAFLLFFLLGITWCFGLLSFFFPNQVFLFIFNFTINLQGFVLFLYFIIFNKKSRNLYVDAFRKSFHRCKPLT